MFDTFCLTAKAALNLDDWSRVTGNAPDLVVVVVTDRRASTIELRLGEGTVTLVLVTAGAFQLWWK